MNVGGKGRRDDDDIYNITINNIKDTSVGSFTIIRLLNHDGIKYNVFISHVTDTALDGKCKTAQIILIGNEWSYLKKQKNQPGDTYRIFIDNVFTTGQTAIRIMETFQDSKLTNIACTPLDTKADVLGEKFNNNGVVVLKEEAQLKNVYIDAIQY
jgi:hypothetical protein